MKQQPWTIITIFTHLTLMTVMGENSLRLTFHCHPTFLEKPPVVSRSHTTFQNHKEERKMHETISTSWKEAKRGRRKNTSNDDDDDDGFWQRDFHLHHLIFLFELFLASIKDPLKCQSRHDEKLPENNCRRRVRDFNLLQLSTFTLVLVSIVMGISLAWHDSLDLNCMMVRRRESESPVSPQTPPSLSAICLILLAPVFSLSLSYWRRYCSIDLIVRFV